MKKLQRYQPLFEMAFSPEKYEESLIQPQLLNIVKHFIKYKLTDSSFSNQIDKRIYVHCFKYKDTWKKQIRMLINSLFNDMNTSSVKKKKELKEDLYLSALENVLPLLSAKRETSQAVKDAVGKHKDFNDLKEIIGDFFIEYNIKTFEWILDILLFLKEIQPKKNIMPSTEFINEKLEKLFKIIEEK